jgi:hypothetical protein
MIYFYDDSKFNINSFKTRKDIKSVWVSNKTPNPISKNMPSYYYADMFYKKYPNNNYAKYMVVKPPLKPTKKINISHTICSRCQIQTGSGLTINEINKISKKKAQTVIFDWDLTLSVCNGIYVPSVNYLHNNVFPKRLNFTFEEMAQFYAGTLERFEALKNMFKKLRENNTKIFILTDNGWGSSPVELVKLLNVYDPDLVSDEIIYGNNDKIKTLNKHPFFKLKKRRSKSWLQNITRKLFR